MDSWIKSLVLCGAVSLVGCANHIKQEVDTSDSTERRELSSSYLITPLQGSVSPSNDLTGSSFAFRLEQETIYHVEDRLTTRVIDYSTPYSGGRELYEIPLGLLATVGAIAVNVVDVALLGLIPNSLTDKPLAVGFAGLNPFMNIESNARAETTLVSETSETKDQRKERLVMPAQEQVVVASSRLGTIQTVTDRRGGGRMELGDIISQEVIEMDLALAAGESLASYGVPLVVRYRAEQVREMMAHWQAQEPSQRDRDALSEDVIKVAEWGFHAESKRMEAFLQVEQ